MTGLSNELAFSDEQFLFESERSNNSQERLSQFANFTNYGAGKIREEAPDNNNCKEKTNLNDRSV